jgi:hypothetical protein
MQLSTEIVAEWWRDRQPEGIFRSTEDFSEAEWERAAIVTDFLDDQATDPEKLRLLIEMLVETAPDERALPFVGTWFLENAYPTLGHQVFSALDAARVTDASRALIRSGFQF